MPGQRFGYPVGSHYTGVRGVRDYLRHIRSTSRTSSAWRGSAQAYASRLGRFALRRGGLVSAAALGAYHLYKNMPYFAQTRRGAKRERSAAFHRPGGAFVDSGTYNNNKRSRSMPSAGANPSVLTMARVKSGRRKSFAKKMQSLMKASLVPYIDRFGALSTTYDAANAFPMAYRTTDTNVTFELPVYLYEINTPAVSNTSRVAAPLMQLKRTTATGNYFFSPVIATNADASANTYAPYIEYNGDSTIANSNAPYGYMDWADIRIAVQGPKKTYSKFTCQMIRFTDDSFQPPCLTTVYVTPSTTPTVVNGRDQPTAGDDLNEWNSFWQEYCAHLLGSPLASRPARVGRKFAVLKTYTCNFQPRSTTDDSITGGVGDSKQIKWFSHIGRTFTYAQADTKTSTVTTAEEINPQEAQDPQGPYIDTHARPRARLFLLLSAYTPVAADGTTDRALTDVACGFDLLVRRKFYFTDHN